jgi:hypothetical protein
MKSGATVLGATELVNTDSRTVRRRLRKCSNRFCSTLQSIRAADLTSPNSHVRQQSLTCYVKSTATVAPFDYFDVYCINNNVCMLYIQKTVVSRR